MVRLRRWVRPRRATIGYVVLSVAVVLAFFFTWRNDQEIEDARVERLRQLNEVNAAQCASLRNLYTVIQKSLLDGDKAIDELAYYRQFPDERRRAHLRNRKTMEMFRTPPCPRDFKLTPK